MILPIVKEPNPILHRKATPVLELTPEVQDLIESMIQTMYAAQGVGLAANQVGSSHNILVASPEGKEGQELVLVNPRIMEQGGRRRLPEGCLSLPGISTEVPRSETLIASGLNREGRPTTLKAQGLLAQILQHEVDHLNGHLFPDRLGLWRRRRLLKNYQKLYQMLGQVQF